MLEHRQDEARFTTEKGARMSASRHAHALELWKKSFDPYKRTF